MTNEDIKDVKQLSREKLERLYLELWHDLLSTVKEKDKKIMELECIIDSKVKAIHLMEIDREEQNDK